LRHVRVEFLARRSPRMKIGQINEDFNFFDVLAVEDAGRAEDGEDDVGRG
jgi:hypothetical protein